MKNNFLKISVLFICINFVFPYELYGFSNKKDIEEIKKSEKLTTDNLLKEKPIDKNFSPKFQEKYSSNEFNYKPIAENKALSAWDRFWRGVSDFFADLFRFSEGSVNGLDILFKIIIYGIIVLAIYLIVRALINNEAGWIFKKSPKKIDLNIGEVDDIKNTDIKALLEKAKLDKNYRLCIRYYYLLVLKSLVEKSIIEWDKEKTNTDYLYEIKDSSTRKDFQLISHIYDYCWYGEFEINETDFNKTEKSFQAIL